MAAEVRQYWGEKPAVYEINGAEPRHCLKAAARLLKEMRDVPVLGLTLSYDVDNDSHRLVMTTSDPTPLFNN